jgi:hypothetical protein
VLAAAGVSAGRHRLPREVTLTRAALVVVALAQLAWVTLPALVLGSDHDAPIHVSHEMGSFDLALAVGFLVAAWRPARAQGMRALVGAAALLLVMTAIIDLAAGRTTLSDEAPHLLAVAGWLLVRHLASLTPSGADDPGVSLRSLLKWRTGGASSTPGQRALTVESSTRELEGYDDLAASGSADVFARAEEPDRRRALAG